MQYLNDSLLVELYIMAFMLKTDDELVQRLEVELNRRGIVPERYWDD
ncbi:hypothetical protein [Radiobacillus deserti]|nr:hypothetical protein [Radiobacillus deserti]